MFRVTMFVDDKKLSELLHSAVGLAIGQPEIQPVANAQKKGGKVVAKTDGSSVERFLDHLKEHKITHFTPGQAKEILRQIGMKPSSISYMIKQLRHLKLVRHNGKTAQASAYTVISK